MALRPESYPGQPPNVGYYPKYHWKLITLTILGAISVAVIAVVVGLTPVYIGRTSKVTNSNVKMEGFLHSRRDAISENQTAIEKSYREKLNAYSANTTIGTQVFKADVTWLTLRNPDDLKGLYYSQLVSIANSALGTELQDIQFTVNNSGIIETCKYDINNGTTCTTQNTNTNTTNLLVAIFTTSISNTSADATLSASNIEELQSLLRRAYEENDQFQATVLISDAETLAARFISRNTFNPQVFQQATEIFAALLGVTNTQLENYNYTVNLTTARLIGAVNNVTLVFCEVIGEAPICSNPTTPTTTAPTTTVPTTTTVKLQNVVQALQKDQPPSQKNEPADLQPLKEAIVKAVGDAAGASTGTWVAEPGNSKLFKLSLDIVYNADLSQVQIQEQFTKVVEAATKATNDNKPAFEEKYELTPQQTSDILTSVVKPQETINCSFENNALVCQTTTRTTTRTTTSTTSSTTTTKEEKY